MQFLAVFASVLLANADVPDETKTINAVATDKGSYHHLTDSIFASYALEKVYSGYFLIFSKKSDDGHEHLKDIIDATAKSAKARGLGTSFALVEADTEKKTVADFSITQFPSLVLVRGGKRTPYTGKIGAVALLKHVTKAELAKVYDIDTKAALSMFTRPYNEGHHPYVVAEFSGTKEEMQTSNAYKSLITAAKEGEVPIAAIHGRAADRISIYTEGHTGIMENSAYTGPLDIPEAMDAWIMQAKVPLVTFLNPDNARNVLRRHFTTMAVLALTRADIVRLRSANSGAVKAFREVAAQYQNGGSTSPKFLVIDLGDGYCRKFMDHYHGGVQLASRNILFSEGAGSELTRYLLTPADAEGDYTAKEIDTFVVNAIKGELNEFRLSQKSPTSDAGDGAKVLVRSTFRDKVIKSNENVLVEFYAPWCKHCQNFAPVYDKLAQAIARNGYPVLVYKIDAVGNDLRDIVNIPGFPTLLFYGQDAKDEPVDFRGHGHLDQADVLKFVLKEINKKAVAEDGKDEL